MKGVPALATTRLNLIVHTDFCKLVSFSLSVEYLILKGETQTDKFESPILILECYILKGETLIFNDEAFILIVDTQTLNDESPILGDETQILVVETPTLDGEGGMFMIGKPDFRAVKSRSFTDKGFYVIVNIIYNRFIHQLFIFLFIKIIFNCFC